MLFTHEQILQLKQQIDFREFYRQFLTLRQQGRNLFATCCFHPGDNTPSLCIDPETGIYHCFSCGAHGDLISFYQRLTGKSFTDAVMDIAKSQNITIEISEELKKEFELKRAMYLMNNNIAVLYQRALSQNKEGQQYLISRNFTMDIIKQFKIGYVPSFKLSDLGEQFVPLLRETGLLNIAEDGTKYNYFSSHRISIPFFDEYGHIVGFSSRVTDSRLKPKYLHSRTSKIFKKDELLYAYNFAKESIKESKTVILTEGQCFKGDAEILTPNGWIRFDKYNGENVMQVNDKLEGSFISPLAIIKKDYNGEMCCVHGRNYDIDVTSDHNIVRFNKKNGKITKTQIQNMPKSIGSKEVIPMAIEHSGEGLPFTDDEIRLMVAISADGSAHNICNGENKKVRIAFKKQRKIERLEMLLKSCNIQYSKSNPPKRQDFTYFGFRYKHAFKKFPTEWIEKSTLHQKQVIINELEYWDGCRIKNRNQVEFVSKYYETVLFMQTLSHLCGYNATIYKKEDDLGLRYRLNILFGKNSASWQNGHETYLYKGKVYCVTVPTGMILIRCNGRISVVGNCDCMRAHQYGITNCVAMCGLALSEKQIKLLKTYVKNYYLIVEDKAGEQSVDRLYDIIIGSSFWSNVKIIRLYEGDGKCDLDEFLQKYGKSAFLEKIKHAPTYHEYKLIDSLKNINYKTIEEKKFHIYNNRKYIAKITNPIDKKQYIELLADKLELPENDVRKVISRYEVTDNGVKVGEYDDRRTTSQKYILASFFSYFGISSVYEVAEKKLKIKNKLDNKFKKIYEKIINIILTYGAKSDIINIVHTTEVMNNEELNILDDAYFKKDDYEYLSDEEELMAFLKDQIENLK